jgi:PAS domain S-box-containing protein
MPIPNSTHEALRTSEVRYRRLFEAARDGILILDAITLQITDVNPFMTELLGYSRVEFLGKELWEIGLFSDKDASQAAFRELQDTGYLRYEDLPLQTRHGESRQVEFVSNVYEEEDDRVIQCDIRDITERKRTEQALESNAEKRAVIAKIGRLALTGGELNDLFAEAVSLVARTLGVEYCRIVELPGGGDALIPRAEVGWKEEYAKGQAIISSATENQAEFTLLSDEPVVVEDWRTETRFRQPPLHEDGVVSGMSVIIRGRDCPYGVLVANTTSLRRFVPDDVNFLQTVANVLAEAIGRKRAEDEVRQSEARFRRVVESNMLGILSWNRSGDITEANDAFLKMVGYTREDLAAGQILWTEMIPPEYRKITEKALEELAASGVCETYELEYICKNGSRITTLVGAAMFEGKQSAVAFVLDISDRKRVEEAFRRSEMRMSEAQRIAHLGSWEWDVLANKTYWSEEHYRIFGLQPQEFGPPMESFLTDIHPDDQALVKRAVTQALEDKVFYELEYRVHRPDGATRVVQANAGVIINDSGQVIKIVGTAQDITDRKRTEETLHKSEEQYRTLFDSIDEGFCIIEVLFDGNDKAVDYRFLEVNPSFEKQTGIHNAVGRTMREFAPQLEEHWFELYGKIALTGEPARFENEAVQLHRWFNVYALRIGEPQERKVAILFKDISERKVAEAALRESEERYRLLFARNPQPMWVFDLETLSFLEVNEAAVHHYGYSREEFLTMTIKAIRPAEDNPKLLTELTGVTPQHEKAGVWQHLKKDGAIIDVEITAHKLIFAGRRAELVLAHDVTERAHIEETQMRRTTHLALRADVSVALAKGDTAFLEGCTEAIVKDLGAAFARIWTLNKEENVLELQASSGMYTHIDGPHARVPVGVYKIGLIAEERQPHITNEVQIDPRVSDKEWAKREGMIAFAGYPLIVEDRLLGVMAMFARKRLADDTLDALASVAEFISQGIERKRAEEALRASEEQLRQSQKLEAIGTLAGGIAHDFNNILAAVMGYSELAQRDISRDSHAQAHLEQVLIACTRARDLVRQILTFSRQKEHEQEVLQLQPIIDETLKLLRVSLPSTIEIRQTVEAATVSVLGDATQIQQVIMNLGVNAGQSMKEHGGILEIRLTRMDIDLRFAAAYPGLKEGPHICLTVTDSGGGMDRAIQERIFEPFFTTKATGEGTGLGLAVVHGIVKNHGGAITVYSEPGVGTTFNVYLPVYDGQQGVVDHTSVSVPRGDGEHILFVDDEKPLVSLAKSMLEDLGYRVTTMTNSVDALAAFRSQPQDYDLVITDQTMPHMNGADLARALLEIRPALPVILATGYSTVMTPDKARAIGIREVLFKPNTMQALGEAIQRALGESKKE